MSKDGDAKRLLQDFVNYVQRLKEQYPTRIIYYKNNKLIYECFATKGYTEELVLRTGDIKAKGFNKYIVEDSNYIITKRNDRYHIQTKGQSIRIF